MGWKGYLHVITMLHFTSFTSDESDPDKNHNFNFQSFLGLAMNVKYTTGCRSDMIFNKPQTDNKYGHSEKFRFFYLTPFKFDTLRSS